MADMEQYPQEWREYQPIQPRGTDWRGLLRKLWAPIAAIGAFLAKFGVVLLKFKFLFSMFVSAAVYVWIGGWWFGIGLVVLLFVHEMGHVLEAKRQGLPVSAPLFVPFLGALITLKQMPHNAWLEARLAIAGPLLGSAGALAIYVAGVAYDSNQLKALAFLGFFINLFNLLPVVPLDGGRITAALHPALWLVGFLGLLGLVIWKPNPILIIILLFSASELWRRWKMRDHPEMQEYYRVEPRQRLIIGILYFGLAIALVLGMHATHVPRNF
jgi:Zn-dependent protease